MTKSNSPRLFDFQVNGFAGVDYQSDQITLADMQRSVQALRDHDTAAIYLTLVTDEIDRLCAQFARFEKMCAADPAIAAMVAGYHLEGPWMSPELGYRGAHPPGPMHAPNDAEYRRLQAAAGGRIRLITLAPEWPGSAEFIARVTAEGVHVSLGHTNANEEQIDAAAKAGARFCTHLGNGAPLILPRHDNVIQRLLARDDLTACFIPDGVHLPPFVLRNFVRAKPPGKVLFTTDCMTAAGSPPGRYTVGRMTVEVGADGIARQPGGGGMFAGSTLTPEDGVKRVAEYLHLPLDEACRLWSDAPAAAFGVKLPS